MKTLQTIEANIYRNCPVTDKCMIGSYGKEIVVLLEDKSSQKSALAKSLLRRGNLMRWIMLWKRRRSH